MKLKEDWNLLVKSIEKIKLERFEIELSDNLLDFLVAGEDHRFWLHYGVDPIGLLRALWKSTFCNRREGGSTVAMQLVRTITKRYEISSKRKLKEIYLAIRLTIVFEKSEILKLYLSIAYFGWNMDGVSQACKILALNKQALSKHEAASLIARLKYPEPRFNNVIKLKAINLRANHIINRFNNLSKPKAISLRSNHIINRLNQLNLTIKSIMEAFKVSTQLGDVIGAYPDAQLISNVAKHGGESARHAIARQWLSEGIPYAFKDCPGVYESVRSWIAVRLDIDPKEVNVTGSARLGQSLAPSKMGKAFGVGSDLDVFIISSDLFDKLKSNFNQWSFDFESKTINSSNDTEDSFWKENLHRGPQNIARGFIDSKIVPNHEKYNHVRNVAQTMYLLKEKLDVTKHAPNVRYASVRCYKSWGCYVQQVSLGLQ
jgi:hypothetical protein